MVQTHTPFRIRVDGTWVRTRAPRYRIARPVDYHITPPGADGTCDVTAQRYWEVELSSEPHSNIYRVIAGELFQLVGLSWYRVS